MSLIQEVEKQTSFPWIKKILIFSILSGIWYIGYSYYLNSENTEPSGEQKIYLVSSWNLITSIESDGKITLKDELNLDFVNPWIVKNILKKEWDVVKAWEVIASLDPTYLDIAIDKAQIALKIAEANYNLKKRGWTQDEISISQKQLESSEASYNSTLSQTEMDIKLAEDNLKITWDNLENTKKQTEINTLTAQNNLDTLLLDLESAEKNVKLITTQEEEKYKNMQNKLIMEVWQMITAIEKNLFDIDIFLWITESNKYANDMYEVYIGAKNTAVKIQADNSFHDAEKGFSTFYQEWKIFKQGTDMSQLEILAWRLKDISSLTNKSLSYTIDTIKNSVPSNWFPQSSLDSMLTNFENALTNLKNEASSFAITIQSTQEAKTAKDIKITTAWDSIISLKQKIKIWKASLEKTILENGVSIQLATQKRDQAKMSMENAFIKKDTSLTKEQTQIAISKSVLNGKQGTDSYELEPFYMAILSAKKNLEEAQLKKNDSQLRSPIDGKIVNISWDIWETTSSLKESFVTIINNETYFVESQVEEEDITKVKVGQKAYISFDAIEWLNISWEVIYVNDKATIDSNGVVSYKTQIIFSSQDSRIREGMSATIQFITKEVSNVLTIPVQSVKTINKKPSVLLEDGTYQTVITGFTDWKMVEVVSGIKKWDKVMY